LLLPKSQTTLQEFPGKDSEQNPGNPGQVVKPVDKEIAMVARTMRIVVECAITKVLVSSHGLSKPGV
jgi:hypothetical protein